RGGARPVRSALALRPPRPPGPGLEPSSDRGRAHGPWAGGRSGREREVEPERLPRGRSCGEDDVLPAFGCGERLALVYIEGRKGQGFAQTGLERFRKRDDARVLRRHCLDVCDLFALEQFVPERRTDSHSAMVAWGHRGALAGW